MNDLTDMCPHFLKGCGGCTHWNLDYNAEVQLKKENLKIQLNAGLPIRVKHPSTYRLRTRFDFTIADKIMGLYSRNRELLDLDSCDILHPELERAYLYLRDFIAKNPLKIAKGSMRIRISPDAKKWGLWLDLANVDTKRLLEERDWLRELSERFIIEVGQKKKRLDSSTMKLVEPQPEVWFKTRGDELLCSISSFTQPAPETADLLTEEILKWIDQTQPERVIEYGCGIGQYSLPILKLGLKLDVFETDLRALEYLKQNTENFQDKLTINNFDRVTDPTHKTLAVVNPSRSGLQKFAQNLIDSPIKYVIYISCFPKSLSLDLKALSNHFALQDIVMVDQFPRTHHYEVGALLQRL